MSDLVLVDLRNEEAFLRELRKLGSLGLTRTVQKATNAAAKVLAPPIRTAARERSRRMGRAVKVARATKQDRPGSLIVFDRDKAFYAHMVIGGTKTHGPRKRQYLAFRNQSGKYIRTKEVRGVNPDPFVGPVVDANERRALDVMIRELGL